MPRNVCVCRTCVDPREHGFFIQHGLSPVNNGFYMARSKGAFVPKPSAQHDVSTTGMMLVQMNDRPSFVFQGHRDCAAVRTLFQSYGQERSALNETEREFYRSYGGALDLVKKIAAALPLQDQLRILEKICVLQGVNNIFEFKDLKQKRGYWPMMHAYYSLTAATTEERALDPEDIDLMIYDPLQGVFVHAAQPESNNGIRISDLIDIIAFVPLSHDPYKIMAPVDLAVVAHNEVRVIVSGAEPRAEPFEAVGNGKLSYRS